ncbi:hypothetical protein D9V32_11705 [Mycetocola tolaasinivorans]|uniref:Uncharacterized protein n=1 Tax=Mycetocola tolaasinivorans TaxID=76635 RepID=A0A3L7A421_9MICO|nr:hypothetical protein [Mycetocola tolaasinivorans]RLP74698.1 hypothetical protein D9V32_11705 [Mycetocola tolaasinivorans]
MSTPSTPRPRRALTQWVGFPVLVLLVYFVAGSILLPLIDGVAHIVAVAVLVAIGLYLLVWLWRWGSGPKAARTSLTSLADVTLHRLGRTADTAGEVTVLTSRTPVPESRFFRSPLTTVRAWRGDFPDAILVPGITSGASRALRVGVQMEGGGKLYLVGFIAPEQDRELLATLEPLAARGEYVSVPAQILQSTIGTGLTIDLDLAVIPAAPNTP